MSRVIPFLIARAFDLADGDGVGLNAEEQVNGGLFVGICPSEIFLSIYVYISYMSYTHQGESWCRSAGNFR